ncbi:MAG: GerMN domain-containing protein [Treponema sp.]|nr:GerMN domain-containing protein [Treponema sp.]
MPTKKSKKKNAIGFALWAIGLIIILIIFLVKQDDIVSNLKTTHAFERLGLKTPEFVEKHEEKSAGEEAPVKETIITLNTQERAQPQSPVREPDYTAAPAAPAVSEPSAATESVQKPVPVTVSEPEQKTQPAPVEPEKTVSPVAAAGKTDVVPAMTQAPAQEKPKPAPVTTNAKLYFVVIEGDGAVSRKLITRSITKTDSPLSANIRQLLAGPNQAERAKGCMSLIPEGTRLLSASVRNGIAMLNFSEEFEYNPVGVEGYLGQLMQIVFTATEFSTVSGVQILIDGQKREYLGSEGVWIGSPLSRTSF